MHYYGKQNKNHRQLTLLWGTAQEPQAAHTTVRKTAQEPQAAYTTVRKQHKNHRQPTLLWDNSTRTTGSPHYCEEQHKSHSQPTLLWETAQEPQAAHTTVRNSTRTTGSPHYFEKQHKGHRQPTLLWENSTRTTGSPHYCEKTAQGPQSAHTTGRQQHKNHRQPTLLWDNSTKATVAWSSSEHFTSSPGQDDRLTQQYFASTYFYTWVHGERRCGVNFLVSKKRTRWQCISITQLQTTAPV